MDKEGKKNPKRNFWRKIGSGTPVMIFFHGYGEDKWSNEAFLNRLARESTVYAIDLPYHGDQDVQVGREFIEKVDGLLKREGVEQYDVSAYSLGAHYAFGMLLFGSNPPRSVHLFAPDALVPNPSQRWMLHTRLGNYLFKHFIFKPGIYRSALKWVARLGFLNQKAADFYLKSVARRTDRFLLFARWVAAHSLIADYPNFYNWLNEHQPKIILYMGRFDKVIPLKKAKAFKEKVPHVEVVKFDLGHRMLRGEVADCVKANSL